MLGTLYIVATPIGNLEDITLRAIRILSEVDIILAEDTRVTEKLLSFLSLKFKIGNYKLISYHQHSSDTKKLEIFNDLFAGKNIALVTDAGTPGISDPGNELISFILEREPNVKIIPIPGVSAITAALSVSGLKVNKFIFLGFWPKKKVTKLVKLIKSVGVPFVFYESPFRIIKTLKFIEGVFGSYVQIYVARELTKMYETSYRGTIEEVIKIMEGEKIKGEIVVIVSV